MKLKQRRQLIEDLNDAFITLVAQEKREEYQRYLNKINNEIIEDINNISIDRVRMIVDKYNIKTEDTALYFSILAALTIIIEKQKLTRQEEARFAPVIAIVALVGLKPKKIARAVINANKGVSNVKVRQQIKFFSQENRELFDNVKRAQQNLIKQSQLKAKLDITTRIQKDVGELLAKGVREDDVYRRIRKKYNAGHIVERALDTEMHAIAEEGKLEVSKELGYTHKIWKTQGDNRVRKTGFHNAVSNMKVEIDKPFVVGNLIADYPGDMRLPAGERIRCRCYLIYM